MWKAIINAIFGHTRPIAPADVDAFLDKRARERSGDWNWRESIVDVMKLLDQPSDLPSRKLLAKEWGYTGELTGSAEMNMWLIKEFRRRIAAGEYD